MKKAVFGLADNENQADRIVAHLQAAGFNNNDISVLFADKAGRAQESIYENERNLPRDNSHGKVAHEKHTKAPEGATSGALSGGVIGGSLGLLAGIGALAIPGAGPFIAAGPIMAALAGSAVGGSVGLLVGGLIGAGIPEYEAKKYENSLKAGGTLICIHTDNADQADRATQILKKDGAKDISTTFEKSRSL